MSRAGGASRYPDRTFRQRRSTTTSATYTWDVFSTVDGYGSFVEGADWGGYWSNQGPELLEHRAALFAPEQRLVFGATPSARTPRS